MKSFGIGRWFSLFFILSLFIGYVPLASAVEVDVLVCPKGCGPLKADIAFSRLIKKVDAELTLKPTPTGGYLDNLELMRNPDAWAKTIFATNDDTLSFGPKGGAHPFTQFIPHAVDSKFKLLHGFYWGTTGHYFITTNPDLKTVADLKGKRLGLGFMGQSDWGMNPTLDLEYAYGITVENTEMHYLGPKKLAKALFSGKVDAIVAALGTAPGLTQWLPSSIFRTLGKSKKTLYYIGHEAGVMETLNEKLGASYIKADIPMGTLPGQTAVITTFADRDFKASHEKFPEELAYKLVMHAAKFGPELKDKLKVWPTWSPEMMVGGLSEENAHPGAIKAFKELGWWKLRENFPVAVLP